MDPFGKSSFDMMLETLPSLSKDLSYLEFLPNEVPIPMSYCSGFPGFESAVAKMENTLTPLPTGPTFGRAISDVYAHVSPALTSPTKAKTARPSKSFPSGPVKPIQHQSPKHSVLDMDGAPKSPTASQAADHGDAAGDSSGKRREKNRIAQRRFRERQRCTVTTLQLELETIQAESDQVKTRIQTLEEANKALAAKLKRYEQAFGVFGANE